MTAWNNTFRNPQLRHIHIAMFGINIEKNANNVQNINEGKK